MLFRHIKKNEQEIDDIENTTRGQSSNVHWKKERQKRITASNFGRICRARTDKSKINIVKSLLYPSFRGSAATRWGADHEEIALSKFSEETGIKIRQCGFFIHKIFNYLGASSKII